MKKKSTIVSISERTGFSVSTVSRVLNGKAELARITDGESNARSGMLYLNILSETKTMVLQSRNLLKSHRRFMEQEGKLSGWARHRYE